MILIAVLALVASAASAGSMVKVVDGDTIDVGNTRYRLHGIDAPEAGQMCQTATGDIWSCGQDATHFVENLVAGGKVECTPKGRDLYGRVIAICRAGGTDIGAEMVTAGLAWAFRKYSEDYVPLEGNANLRRVGVWQAENEAPWEYRARKWEGAVAQSTDRGCPIKGNINRRNERIYHTPWSKDYAKTKIDIASGERWFCSEDEAIAAGWRAPAWGRQ